MRRRRRRRRFLYFDPVKLQACRRAGQAGIQITNFSSVWKRARKQ